MCMHQILNQVNEQLLVGVVSWPLVHSWRKLFTGLAVQEQRSWPPVRVGSQPLLGG